MALGFNSLIVKDITVTGKTAAIITLDIPENLASNYRFKPGQYVTIEQEIAGEKIRRAYSICSPSYEKDIAIGVRLLEGGKMSTFLNKQLKTGDTLYCSVPDGRFVTALDQDQQKDYYFIAAGSGITPIVSMIKSVIELEPKSVCHLIYGNRFVNTIMFNTELSDLAKRYEGQLFIQHTLSQQIGALGNIKKGRIDASSLTRFLEEYPSRNKVQEYYICGPFEMINVAEDYLLGVDIGKKQIHKEVFFDANASPSDYKKPSGDSSLKQLEVDLDGEIIKMEIPADTMILDALTDAGHEPPYSCMSGACSTCVAKVVEGTAAMDLCYALEDEEVEDGYILTCQAKITSDSIKIKF